MTRGRARGAYLAPLLDVPVAPIVLRVDPHCGLHGRPDRIIGRLERSWIRWRAVMKPQMGRCSGATERGLMSGRRAAKWQTGAGARGGVRFILAAKTNQPLTTGSAKNAS